MENATKTEDIADQEDLEYDCQNLKPFPKSIGTKLIKRKEVFQFGQHLQLFKDQIKQKKNYLM